MIYKLIAFGGPVLLAVWFAGIFGVWRGKPKLSLLASSLGMVLGVVCAVSGMVGPRHSNFWTGDAGNGDGFGLIGLFLLGAMLAGAAFVLLIITVVVGSIRANKTTQESPE